MKTQKEAYAILGNEKEDKTTFDETFKSNIIKKINSMIEQLKNIIDN